MTEAKHTTDRARAAAEVIHRANCKAHGITPDPDSGAIPYLAGVIDQCTGIPYLTEENEKLRAKMATLRAAAHQAGGVLDGALAMGHIPSANRPVVERVLGRLRAALAATDETEGD